MNKRFVIVDGIFAPVIGDSETYFRLGKLEKMLAYIYDDHCYIYGGKMKNNPEYGYFYKDMGRLIYFPAKNFERTHISNIKSLEELNDELNNPDLLKEVSFDEALRDPNIFYPPIKENDDPFKRIIKLVLEDLKIDMKEISRYFNKDYETSNLRVSITRDAVLSTKNLLKWLEILGLEMKVSVNTKENAVKHLTKPINMVIS